MARGNVYVDVWADDHAEPANVLAVECKRWARPVSKDVVHGFRTVVGDSGANTGLLVSSAGFQQGAEDAAAYSNVRLLSWDEFQRMFAVRWFKSFMAPTVADATDPLHEYTEPVNIRVERKANALPVGGLEAFRVLRDRFTPLMVTNFALHPVVVDNKHSPVKAELPTLPLRSVLKAPKGQILLDSLPDDVLDAVALRPLMERLIHHSAAAIAEFDALSGERA